MFDWLKMLREGGVESLLQRDKPGPRTGDFKLLKGKPLVKKQLQQDLQEGRWKTSPQLSRWLKEKHGLEVKTNTALTWFTPCEQAWDMIKDEVSNHCYGSIDKLRDALLPRLKRFWDDAAVVLRLVGCTWLQDQANVSYPV